MIERVLSILSLECGLHRRTEIRRALRHANARGLEGLDLVSGGALPARDDRAGVSHPLALRRSLAADESRDRLLHVLLHELRRGLLGAAADLADHDDAFGLGIVLEETEY